MHLYSVHRRKEQHLALLYGIFRVFGPPSSLFSPLFPPAVQRVPCGSWNCRAFSLSGSPSTSLFAHISVLCSKICWQWNDKTIREDNIPTYEANLDFGSASRSLHAPWKIIFVQDGQPNDRTNKTKPVKYIYIHLINSVDHPDVFVFVRATFYRNTHSL